jgi:hypothetical protein
MKHLPTFIALLAVWGHNCTTPKEKAEPSVFCSSAIEHFFSGPDSLQTVTFNPADSLSVLKQQFLTLPNNKTEFLIFNIHLTRNIKNKPVKLLIHCLNPNYVHIPAMYKRIEYWVLVNSNNQILCDGDHIEIPELKDRIKKFLLNSNKEYNDDEPRLKGRVSLGWDTATASDCFWQVVNQIVTGYQDAINELAQQKYQKPICQLTETEAANVLKEFRFFIEFSYPELYKWAEPHDFDTLKFIEN